MFVLLSILLIGLIILVFSNVAFVFYPIKVFFSTVVLPIILATIAYYLLRPILRFLERYQNTESMGDTYYLYRSDRFDHLIGISRISIFERSDCQTDRGVSYIFYTNAHKH